MLINVLLVLTAISGLPLFGRNVEVTDRLSQVTTKAGSTEKNLG